MNNREVSKVLARATLIALVVYVIFAISGNFYFTHVLQVPYDTFRVFGGLIISYFSFEMIVHGKKSFISYSDDHSAVADQIAMPVMVGAGTISIAILMGTKYTKLSSCLLIALVLAINYFAILFLVHIRHAAVKRYEEKFDKNMETILRLLAFMGGAIGLDMIVVGIKGLM